MQNGIGHFSTHSYLSNPLVGREKSLGTKPLSGGVNSGGDLAAECARWVEQNMHVYQAVLGGQSGLSQQDQALFLDYYQYAYATAFGTASQAWDPAGAAATAPTSATLPPGAKLGPNQNIVFNAGSAEFTYAEGVAQPIDVLSDEFTLNVPVKAKVEVERTTDTRVQPSHEVFKITIHDPSSTPAETVIFAETDAKIAINTVGGKDVTLAEGLSELKAEDGEALITVGEVGAADDSVDPEASMKGVEDKDQAGRFVYTPEYEGGTIDFHAQPGENQEHVVWSQTNIFAKPGDSANVTMQGEDLKIVVTHSDQSTDTYVVKHGYSAQLNINPEYVTFDGAKPEDGQLPEAYGEKIKVPSLSAKETETPENDALQILLQETGKSSDQLLGVLSSVGFTGIETEEDLKAAVAAGSFPPPEVDIRLVKLLYLLDDEFSQLMDKSATAVPKEATAVLVELLGKLYPQELVKPGKNPDQFSIGSKSYQVCLNPGDSLLKGWLYTF